MKFLKPTFEFSEFLGPKGEGPLKGIVMRLDGPPTRTWDRRAPIFLVVDISWFAAVFGVQFLDGGCWQVGLVIGARWLVGGTCIDPSSGGRGSNTCPSGELLLS